MLMLLAKFEFDRWFHFFKKQGIIKKVGFPLNLMTSSLCHQMCMNGKVNQGFLISVFDATDQ